MSDRSDALVQTLRLPDGSGRRQVIEPRDDGRYDVVEKVLTKGGDWREVGHEIATDVELKGGLDGAAVLQEVGPDR